MLFVKEVLPSSGSSDISDASDPDRLSFLDLRLPPLDRSLEPLFRPTGFFLRFRGARGFGFAALVSVSVSES